ncbi:protoheme IX farnesyltransferase [Halovenus aranensis]|uniref:Protoheme IX farnesyltransferase n=1 Tax=Halovenus aranensis TaxID=890420 RepID=A0A1G8VSF9_9EURY|nr:heme o synthase [Halovenus aranensis]SDJ68944.1 protoheme IX farnesyltransferase [Halovenus aranensis]
MRLWNLTTRQFETVLAATTLAVYVLIATGATLASTGTTTCSQWPVCVSNSGLFTPGFLLVVGHRALTALVGLLLAVTLLGGLSVSLDWRARVALYSVGVAFPLQVSVGALVVLTDVSAVTEIHLALGTCLFVLLLTALSWTLEDGTGESDTATPEPAVTERDVVTDETSAQSHSERPSAGATATARAYLELTKPRLMWLLCLLALAGMALATTTGQWPTGLEVAGTLTGGILAIGASGTFNHLYERDRDQQMERTNDRPVATNEIPPRNAAAFGCVQLALAMGILLVFVNALAAALTLAAVVYYSVVYTVVLKPNTSWNIAIGGGAGALPALIGWAGVTGSVGLGGLLLAVLVVVWTPPHFYNLAIVYRDDYARAGYPMFPVIAGVPAARRRILLTLGATLLVTVGLVVWTPLAWLFTVASVLAGGLFFWSTVSQCRLRTRDATMQTFFISIAYLGIVLGAIVVETVAVHS